MIQNVKNKIKGERLEDKDTAIEKRLLKIEKKTRESIKNYKNVENTKLMGFLLTSIMMASNNPLMNAKRIVIEAPQPKKNQYKSALTPQAILDNLNNKLFDSVADIMPIEDTGVAGGNSPRRGGIDGLGPRKSNRRGRLPGIGPKTALPGPGKPKIQRNESLPLIKPQRVPSETRIDMDAIPSGLTPTIQEPWQPPLGRRMSSGKNVIKKNMKRTKTNLPQIDESEEMEHEKRSRRGDRTASLADSEGTTQKSFQTGKIGGASKLMKSMRKDDPKVRARLQKNKRKLRVCYYGILLVKCLQYSITRKKKIAVDYFKFNYHHLENATFLALKKSIVRIIFKTWTVLPATNIVNDNDICARYEWAHDDELVEESVDHINNKVSELLLTIRDNVNEVTYPPRLAMDFRSMFCSEKVVPKGFLFAKEIERLEFTYAGLFKNVTVDQKKMFLAVFVFIKIFLKKIFIVPKDFAKDLEVTPRIRLNIKIISSLISYYVHAYLVANCQPTEFDQSTGLEKSMWPREKSKLDPEAPLMRGNITVFWVDELTEADLQFF